MTAIATDKPNEAGHGDPMEVVHSLLSVVYARKCLRSFLFKTAWLLIVVVLLALCRRTLSGIIPSICLRPELFPAAPIVMLLLSIAIIAVIEFCRTPDNLQIAWFIDQEAGLQERLTSALELIGSRQDPQFTRFVCLDASNAAKSVHPEQIVPLRIEAVHVTAIAAVIVIIVLIFIPPSPLSMTGVGYRLQQNRAETGSVSTPVRKVYSEPAASVVARANTLQQPKQVRLSGQSASSLSYKNMPQSEINVSTSPADARKVPVPTSVGTNRQAAETRNRQAQVKISTEAQVSNSLTSTDRKTLSRSLPQHTENSQSISKAYSQALRSQNANGVPRSAHQSRQGTGLQKPGKTAASVSNPAESGHDHSTYFSQSNSSSNKNSQSTSPKGGTSVSNSVSGRGGASASNAPGGGSLKPTFGSIRHIAASSLVPLDRLPSIKLKAAGNGFRSWRSEATGEPAPRPAEHSRSVIGNRAFSFRSGDESAASSADIPPSYRLIVKNYFSGTPAEH